MGKSTGVRQSLIALDILRGMAAIAVLLGHVRGGSFVEFGALPADQRNAFVAVFFGLTRLGQLAILTFFVLSGFFVGGQIISRLRENDFCLRDYAIDRFTRIMLPLVPACVFTAFISSVFFSESIRFGDLVGNMVGLNGVLVPTLSHNAALWTLAFEIWFYIVGGVIGYLLSGKEDAKNNLVFLALIVCISVFSVLPARYLLYWILGAVATILVNARHRAALGCCGLFFLVLGAIFFELAVPSKSFENLAFVPMEVSEAMMCAGLFLALPWLCNSSLNDRLKRLKRVAALISGFSYTLYLFHTPTSATLDLIFARADRITFQSLVIFGLRILICLVVAWIAFMLFERNTPRFRKYLKSRLTTDPRAPN